MRRFAVTSFLMLCVLIVLRQQNPVRAEAAAASQPAYAADGKLLLPADYREWVFLSSGFGMNYSTGPASHPAFTNVFVTQKAFQSFKATGKWPDKSMFVVEIYSPASHGSINKSGYYQESFLGLDVEVKDSSRPSQWSYYNFNPGTNSAEAMGGGACNKCHSENGAVEHTFVQFYPTLLDIARKTGSLKPTAGASPKP